MIGTNGTHIVLDLWGVEAVKLDNKRLIKQLLTEAATYSNATVLKTFFHKFEPVGVTGVVVISESHISIHTWPQEGYASVDIYTCGLQSFPERAMLYLIERLGASKYSIVGMDRGGNGRTSITLRSPVPSTSLAPIMKGVPNVIAQKESTEEEGKTGS